MNQQINSFIDSRSQSTTDLLARLIKFRSTVGNEREIQEYLAEYAKGLGFAPRLVPIQPDIESDESYTRVPDHKGYEGRANVVFEVTGSGGGRSVILNSHVDVVPGTDSMFEGKVENGIIHGRGAVDAKGQVVTILLALTALKEAGVELEGDVISQFVIEEEAGGNGALSVILDGMRADGVVVMEATGSNIHPANRGAIWFKLDVEGKATHMGRWREGVNAIEEMIGLIDVLKDYEKKLVEESVGDPLFPDTGGNVKVNLGTIKGGDWPSMVADHCQIEGGVGFLPNKRLFEIRDEVRRALETNANYWAREHFKLEFTRLHNEAYRTPPDHPLVRTLQESARELGLSGDVTGMTASCDARLFYHRGEMPTVVFGPGEFTYAHSIDEQVSIDEINRAAKILADFLMRWCGTRGGRP